MRLAVDSEAVEHWSKLEFAPIVSLLVASGSAFGGSCSRGSETSHLTSARPSPERNSGAGR